MTETCCGIVPISVCNVTGILAAILEYKKPPIDGITGSFSISRSSDLILWVGNVAEPGPGQLQQPQLRAAPVDMMGVSLPTLMPHH